MHYAKIWEDALKDTDEWWYECKHKEKMQTVLMGAPYIDFGTAGGSNMLFTITDVVRVLKEVNDVDGKRIFQYNFKENLNYTTKLKFIQNKLYQPSFMSANHCQKGSTKSVATLIPCAIENTNSKKRKNPPSESYSYQPGPRCKMCSKKMRRKVSA